MKNDSFEMVFILDRSGSMAGLESDTMGGFNSLIKKQKGIEGECFVTTVLFDHELVTLHDRLSLDEVPEMTEKDYQVRGSTALIDAIGDTVEHIGKIHKYARPEDVPGKTTFVIITDGYENASRRFSSDQVKKMIENKKEDGWEFLFIGANIDAVETAKHFGIAENRAVDYCADAEGTETVYECLSDSIGELRAAPCCGKRTFSDNWSRKIALDHKKRGRNNK